MEMKMMTKMKNKEDEKEDKEEEIGWWRSEKTRKELIRKVNKKANEKWKKWQSAGRMPVMVFRFKWINDEIWKWRNKKSLILF